MRKYELTEEIFLKEIQSHEMTVIVDNGMHRHLRFKKPNTGDMHFDIVTYPGYLVYSGDMGCFVFSRIADMFQFFRDKGEGELRVNPQYWAQKLDAADRNGGYQEYSADKFRKWMTGKLEEFREHIELDTSRYEDEDDEAAAEIKAKFDALNEAINIDVMPHADDGEHAIYTALSDFEHEGKDWFADCHEANFREYTVRYLWCCYALVWAIRKYDQSKVTA